MVGYSSLTSIAAEGTPLTFVDGNGRDVKAESFAVVDATGREVFRGPLGAAQPWDELMVDARYMHALGLLP